MLYILGLRIQYVERAAGFFRHSRNRVTCIAVRKTGKTGVLSLSLVPFIKQVPYETLMRSSRCPVIESEHSTFPSFGAVR